MKKGTVRVLIAATAILLLACAPVFAQRTLKLGHARPIGSSTDIDMKAFAEAVAKGTNGRVKVELYPASQLGNYTVVQERVGIGDVDMQLAPAGTNVTKAMGIVTTPYLCDTWDEIAVKFARGGKLLTAVEKMFDKEGIRILGLYPKYFGGVALSKLPRDVKGTSNQGMKVRVPGIRSFEKTAEALGYMATPIAFSEAFTSWQTGIVEGIVGSGAEGYWSSFRDLTKVYLPLNTHLELWFLYISKDVYNKLSAADRKVLDEAGLAMERARYATGYAETAEMEANLAKNGTNVVKYSPAELQGDCRKR
jgi:TRAP-type transport system periplasmic protein